MIDSLKNWNSLCCALSQYPQLLFICYSKPALSVWYSHVFWRLHMQLTLALFWPLLNYYFQGVNEELIL